MFDGHVVSLSQRYYDDYATRFVPENKTKRKKQSSAHSHNRAAPHRTSPHRRDGFGFRVFLISRIAHFLPNCNGTRFTCAVDKGYATTENIRPESHHFFQIESFLRDYASSLFFFFSIHVCYVHIESDRRCGKDKSPTLQV